MNDTIIQQILSIRASGETNMFDVPVVLAIAQREGMDELSAWLPENTLAYCNFILTGETARK